ncbi:hypothetical protein CAEBREN_19497 [Caenorhabditis brenneri]|uniref:DUF38 domain-containing protein n=1 Tax=Caenorhabditis brenneri TaxID=135651 RepID=G0MMF5_CAEBE|nr:hypothetical protein CAEBREN_19497 [Caenorhabditis brenneri]
MDTPPEPLVGPDNEQIVLLVRDEYMRRSSLEEAFERVCTIIALLRQNPEELNPDIAALQNAQREQQEVEETPRNDSERVEPGTKPPRDLKRAEPTSDEPSPQKRMKLEEGTEEAPQLSRELPGPQETRESEEQRPKRPSLEYYSKLDDSAEYDHEEEVAEDTPMDISNPNSDTTLPPQLTREQSSRGSSPLDERAQLDRDEEVELDEHPMDISEENLELCEDGDEAFWERTIAENQQKPQTPKEEKRREESGRGTPFTDTDSEDCGIEMLDDVEANVDMPVENVNDFDVFTLDVVKEVYRILAVWEFNLVTEEPLELDDIPKVLHFRKFAPVKLVNFPIDILEVTIGYRNIIFDIRHAPTKTFTCIQYLSHTEGCVFQYNETSVLIKGIKYQSLAAKDYFFMVRHKDAFFEKLAIKISNYETPAIYPFQSFLWKLDNYFSMKSDFQLSVLEFSMTTFYHNTSGDRGRNLIQIFWPKLVPTVLSHVIFRVWNDKSVRRRLDLLPTRDRHLTRDLYLTQQWKGITQLDIHDENIVIDPNEYVHFTHLEMIRIYLPRNDHRYRHFKKLVNLSDTWRNGNEDLKVIIFRFPKKGDTSVQEALEADLEQKKRAFDEFNNDFVFKKQWFTGRFWRPH